MEWWVVPEGTIGQAIDFFSWNSVRHYFGITGNQAVWTVRQSATRPPHAADVGPFSTRAEAQSAASALNRQQNLLTGAEQAAGVNDQPTKTSLSPGNFLAEISKSSTILRVAEGILGILLVSIAVDKLMDGNAGAFTKIAKVVK